jgi:hypothetical protein
MGDQGGKSSSSGFQRFAKKSSATHVARVPAFGVARWLAVIRSPIVNARGGEMALKYPVVRSRASSIIQAARSRTSTI